MPEEQATEGRPEKKTWFDQMTGYLKWKVIGPDIYNPYKSPLPLHILIRMLNQRDYLSSFVSVRCMCDGYEVMMISNPVMPRIITSHPTISRMERAEIVDYIRRESLDAFIDAEIDRIHEEIASYLQTREKDDDAKTDATGKPKTGSYSSRVKEEKNSSNSKNFRIVKR